MVDVGAKAVTVREAVAEGAIRMHADTLRLIVRGGHKKATCWPPRAWPGCKPPKKPPT